MEQKPFATPPESAISNYEAQLARTRYLNAMHKRLLTTLVSENKSGTVDIAADAENSWTVVLGQEIAPQVKAQMLTSVLEEANDYCEAMGLEPDTLSVNYTPLH